MKVRNFAIKMDQRVLYQKTLREVGINRFFKGLEYINLIIKVKITDEEIIELPVPQIRVNKALIQKIWKD